MTMYVFEGIVDVDTLKEIVNQYKQGYYVYKEGLTTLSLRKNEALSIEEPFYCIRIFSDKEDLQIRPQRFGKYRVVLMTDKEKPDFFVSGKELVSSNTNMEIYLHETDTQPYRKLMLETYQNEEIGMFHKWTGVKR